MTNSAGKTEDTRQPTPPAPEELARRLLAYEAGEKTSPEELAVAGEHTYLQLRERLAVLLGAAGFDALWARAIHLALPAFRTGNNAAAQKESFPTQASRTYGLHAAVYGHRSDAIQHNLVVVFASFITLLFTFIGDELGFRFIRQIWPDLPLDAAASHAEDATQ